MLQLVTDTDHHEDTTDMMTYCLNINDTDCKYVECITEKVYSNFSQCHFKQISTNRYSFKVNCCNHSFGCLIHRLIQSNLLGVSGSFCCCCCIMATKSTLQYSNETNKKWVAVCIFYIGRNLDLNHLRSR